MEKVAAKGNESSTSSNFDFPDIEDPAEAKRLSILKQKRVLRRYLRLRRNNFFEKNQE